MRDVYSAITDQIVASLEKGVRPWFKPWSSQGGDRITRPLRHNGQPYRGINVLALWITAEMEGYSSPYWMTFNQAKEFGAFVKKGSKGTQVVYANRGTATDEDTGETRSFAYLKTYTVFNAEQIEGLPEKYNLPQAEKVERPAHARIADADAFFNHLGMDLRHGGGRAFYSPSEDYVRVPAFEDFETAEAYYCTLAHESVHWTSPKKRLDREFGQKRWGDEGYAMEELVAELGSAFLAADLGITGQPRDDHASYLAHWLKVLKDDKRAIFSMASHAERAVDYLRQQQPSYAAEVEATTPIVAARAA
jgi:antirestriction protein ArdC